MNQPVFLAQPIFEFSKKSLRNFENFPKFDIGSCCTGRMRFFLFLGARLSPPPNPPKPNEKALKEKMDEKDLLSHPTNGKHKNSDCLTKNEVFFLRTTATTAAAAAATTTTVPGQKQT